jgi:hypothetical protein
MMSTKLSAVLLVAVAIVGFYGLGQFQSVAESTRPDAARTVAPIWTLVSQEHLLDLTANQVDDRVTLSLAQANAISISDLGGESERFFIAGVLPIDQFSGLHLPDVGDDPAPIIFTGSSHAASKIQPMIN